ncbi:hypothetical protein J4440_01375 [Candidatus Woesearchaeota archaeon]|nr:hypothetical protein [Candidatus Woesearchaeota archaeon]
MEELPLTLEEALKISKGDKIKTRNSWEIRNLSKIIKNSIIPGREYVISKIKEGRIGNRKTRFFYINDSLYSYYWFSDYKKV